MTLLDHIDKLRECPPGRPGWKEFEDICIDILTDLFVPPLSCPLKQSETLSRIDRRDVIFPNPNYGKDNHWGRFFYELNARFILFEFKNYDKSDIGKDEVNQVRNYLTEPIGKLGILCCNKEPDMSAHIKRNTVYCEEKKIILFLLPEHLEEMLYSKDSGDDPSDTIYHRYVDFCTKYE